MLRELVPGVAVIATLTDANFPEAVVELRAVEEASRTIGQKIMPVNDSNEREIDAAFASIAQAGAGALVVIGSPLFTSKSQMLVALSARYAIPAIYDREIDAAFASIAQAGAGALVVIGSPLFTSKSQMLVALSARYAIPAIYDLRDYVAVGGLISYSASFTDAYRQAGVYAGRILKGAKPSELPVLQPTTFELVINRKTATALGLNVPQSLIARADEVIE